MLHLIPGESIFIGEIFIIIVNVNTLYLYSIIDAIHLNLRLLLGGLQRWVGQGDGEYMGEWEQRAWWRLFYGSTKDYFLVLGKVRVSFSEIVSLHSIMTWWFISQSLLIEISHLSLSSFKLHLAWVSKYWVLGVLNQRSYGGARHQRLTPRQKFLFMTCACATQ